MNAESLLNLTSDDSAPRSSIRKNRTIEPDPSLFDSSQASTLTTSNFAKSNGDAPRQSGTTPRASVDALFASLEPTRAERNLAREIAVGTVLDGKYRIERKIGEGAMGVVLAATHLGLEENVAVKFMRPEVLHMEGTLARFTKEAKIAARIRSEHVAKVLDVGELEPLGPYIVMEYLEGKSLAELLEARLDAGRGPLPVDRVVEYMLQACEALAAAHALGVIHRDVKPDNLFLTRHAGLETLKLLDFGISKATLGSCVPGADIATSTISFVMGTPLYMSPEQLRSQPDIDCRTDVWSMGAVIFELLSGDPPFRAESIPEICAAILDAPCGKLPSHCPAALEAVVLRCLEKDPARRFQTVADLAAALVPLASGDARAYASRSYSILRASALNLKIGPEVRPLPAEPGRPAPRVRFQSSALVAAATVLALSALGVATILTKDRSPALPVRVGVASAAPIALTVQAPLSEPTTPMLRISPVTRAEPALPHRDRPSGPTTPAKSKARKVASGRSSGSAGTGVSLRAADGKAHPRRVRLVESRSKLRLVDGASGRGASVPGEQ